MKIGKQLARLIIIFGVALTSVMFNYFFEKQKAIQQWSEAKATANRLDALKLYKHAYPFLQENGLFLFDYGKTLYEQKEFEKSLLIFKESDNILADVNTILFLGHTEYALNNFKKAEEYYFKASYSIPSRLYPKYFLLKLYINKKTL